RPISSDQTRQKVKARFIDTNQGSALPRRLPTQFGPHFDPPVCDDGFVALDCPSNRNLRRPTQILQQAGDVIPVVEDPEFPLDDLGDTGTGPNIATETISFGSVPEKIRNLVSLRNGQLCGVTRRNMEPERLGPAF